MADYIKTLIAGGENQHLDFKFEVSDFRKIARTLVAFSNTDGGRLLIGVKDNGAIAGVRSEEEYFMIDGAARLYCRPEIGFQAREWQVEGRRVMEIIIEKGSDKPYRAQDEDGNWIAYIRQADQNFKAHRVMLNIWARQREGSATTIHFRQAEKTLLHDLTINSSITISRFRRLAGLSSKQAEKIMVDFMMLDILGIEHTAAGAIFFLKPGFEEIVEQLKKKVDRDGNHKLLL